MSIDTLDEYYSYKSKSMKSINEHYEKELSNFENEEIFRTLTCPVCFDLNLNMLVDSCQHPVCSDCLEELFVTMSVHSRDYRFKKCAKCPMCKYVIIKERMKPFRFIKEMIDFMIIPCEFKKHGCPYKGKFIDYHRQHRQNCIFKISTCKIKFCNFKGRTHEVLNHYKTCKFQILECKKCRECFIYDAYQEHLKKCPQL
jgi:hypothetical protein